MTRAVGRDFGSAPEIIGTALRGARELSAAERRFVGDAVHELFRHRLRLVFLAGSDEPAALLDAWLDDLLDPAASEARLVEVPDPFSQSALRVSFPPWLYARLVAGLGAAEAQKAAMAMNRRAPLCVRANRLLGSREELARRLADIGIRSSPTRLAPDGLVLDGRPNVYGLAPFRAGWMEVQDEGSQLIAELSGPLLPVGPPGIHALHALHAPDGLADAGATAMRVVVDACAGAGGKTLALGAMMKNGGRLYAFDVHRPKLDELAKRARRAGLTNVEVRLAEEGALPAAPGLASAARVLVDAPCSGLGVLRRHPETRFRLRPEDLDALPQKQRALLSLYARLVAPGGHLIYATCSVLPDENDRVVADFLATHSQFQLLPARALLGDARALAVGDGEVLRLLPHRHDTDGFFAAVMCRR